MRRTRVVAGLLCAVAAAAVLAAPALEGRQREHQLRRHQQDQGRRPAALAGDGAGSWLSDVYAPRLTGSPTVAEGRRLGRRQDEGMGPDQREDRAVGEPERLRPRLDQRQVLHGSRGRPEKFPIPGTPTAWTPGTNGLVSGEVVLVTATTEDELAPYKGKLKGKWVLTQAAPDVAAFWDAAGEALHPRGTGGAWKLRRPPQPEFGVTPPGGGRQGAARGTGAAPGRAGGAPAPAQAAQPGSARRTAGGGRVPAAAIRRRARRGGRLRAARNDFFRAEGVLGTISTAPRGHGIYTIGGNRAADPATTLPAIVDRGRAVRPHRAACSPRTSR